MHLEMYYVHIYCTFKSTQCNKDLGDLEVYGHLSINSYVCGKNLLFGSTLAMMLMLS